MKPKPWGVVPRVVRTKRGQSGHFWRYAKIALGDALALQRSTSSAVSHLRSTTATCGSAPQQPELPCDLVRGQGLSPQRAQQRPSNADVGV